MNNRENALMIECLQDLIEKAKSKNQDKVLFNYRKALKSLQKYPLKLNSGKEAMMLEGIGDNIAKKIDEYLKKNGIKAKEPSDDEESDSEKEKKKKKEVKYIPKYKTAPWALLVGLHRGCKDKELLSKEELITISTPLSDVSMKPQYAVRSQINLS